MALLALPALQGWQYLTLVSPVFVTILLTRVSGLPLLEARADKKMGRPSRLRGIQILDSGPRPPAAAVSSVRPWLIG